MCEMIEMKDTLCVMYLKQFLKINKRKEKVTIKQDLKNPDAGRFVV